MKKYTVLATKRSGHSAIQYWLDQQPHINSTDEGQREYLGDAGEEHHTSRGYAIQKTETSVCVTPNRMSINIAPRDNEIFTKNAIFDIQCEQLNLLRENGTYLPKALGNIEDTQVILVVRSWWNNLASYIQFVSNSRKLDDEVESLEIRWKTHAKEALGLTNYLPNAYIILYDWWVASKLYRWKICWDLDLIFSDNGFNNVSHHGNGSSFDLLKYKNDARKMDVLRRYKKLDNYVYLYDEKNIELSRDLFGSCPEFLDNYNSKRFRWWRDNFPWLTKQFKLIW